MHSSTSARLHSSCARPSAAAGSISPNSTTSGLIGWPQTAQRGTPSGSPARRSRTSASGTLPGQLRQVQPAMLPWTSISSRVPALRWSMSTFCVITASRLPRRSISTSARWAPLGCLLVERGEALAVEAPEARRGRCGTRRCARPPSGRRSPTCPCRASGSRGCPTAPTCRRRSARRPSARSRTSSTRRWRSGPELALNCR